MKITIDLESGKMNQCIVPIFTKNPNKNNNKTKTKTKQNKTKATTHMCKYKYGAKEPLITNQQYNEFFLKKSNKQ
jgi:hypothetical protein